MGWVGNEMERTPSQTEDSAERGLAKRQKDAHDPETYKDLGQSKSPEGEETGDVADEGRGHRG